MNLAVILVQQPTADQTIHIALDDLRQLVLLPVHVQFALQVRVQRADQTLNLFAVHAWVVQEQAGDQRRQGNHMQNIIAVPGQQYGLGLVQIQNFAQCVGLATDHAHAFHMTDLLGTGERRQRYVVTVGCSAQ